MIDQEKITIVRADDWAGLYSGGILMKESHSIQIEDVLSLIGIEYENLYIHSDWLEAEGQLPQTLSELKKKERW